MSLSESPGGRALRPAQHQCCCWKSETCFPTALGPRATTSSPEVGLPATVVVGYSHYTVCSDPIVSPAFREERAMFATQGVNKKENRLRAGVAAPLRSWRTCVCSEAGTPESGISSVFVCRREDGVWHSARTGYRTPGGDGDTGSRAHVGWNVEENTPKHAAAPAVSVWRQPRLRPWNESGAQDHGKMRLRLLGTPGTTGLFNSPP